MNSLFEKFSISLKTGTPAEKRLARYFLEHPSDISFETAASVADRLDLSPMTVGRFLRSMEIEKYPAPVVQRPAASPLPAPVQLESAYGNSGLAEKSSEFSPFRLHHDALSQVQSLASQSVWRDVVDMLSRHAEIFVTAQGVLQPIASYLCLRLSEVRDGVRHLSGGDGTYLDLLGTRREDCLLVVLDDHLAPHRLRRLCRAARDEGHRVLMLTSARVDDVSPVVDLALHAPSVAHTGELDAVALTAMIELAVSGVGAAKGPFATERVGRARQLHRLFSDHA